MSTIKDQALEAINAQGKLKIPAYSYRIASWANLKESQVRTACQSLRKEGRITFVTKCFHSGYWAISTKGDNNDRS